MADIIVVHGNPGSGKSTQCGLLVRTGLDQQEVEHFSIGDRMRDIRTRRVESRHADFINDPEAPSPLPDSIVNDAMFEVVPTANSAAGLIIALIDGYPRHPSAVDLFLSTIKSQDHRLLGVIALQVPLEISVERIMSRGQRKGERVSQDTLRDFTVQRNIRDIETTKRAIDKLGDFTTVKTIDASSNKEDVAIQFRAAAFELKKS